jgi:hypothetical protein
MRRLALIAAAALAASCGGSTTSPSVVTTPAATVTTDTFTGTLQPLGLDTSHTFIVQTAGSVAVTLTQAGPPAAVILAIGVGIPGAAGACSISSSNTTTAQAGISAQLNLSAPPGTYCIGIQEFQGLGPLTYTVTVAHT